LNELLGRSLAKWRKRGKEAVPNALGADER
jgi:hypothetical protein